MQTGGAYERSHSLKDGRIREEQDRFVFEVNSGRVQRYTPEEMLRCAEEMYRAFTLRKPVPRLVVKDVSLQFVMDLFVATDVLRLGMWLGQTIRKEALHLRFSLGRSKRKGVETNAFVYRHGMAWHAWLGGWITNTGCFWWSSTRLS